MFKDLIITAEIIVPIVIVGIIAYKLYIAYKHHKNNWF